MHRFPFLGDRIRDGLEEATREEGRSRNQRLTWLVGHIDEYIDRWYGFFALPDTPLESLVQGNGFEVIEFALDILQEEIPAGEVDLATACARARGLLQSARRATAKDQVPDLRRISRDLRSALVGEE